jgi:hypothetical protein
MANFTEFINSLSAQTGLNKSVIAAWVSREQGVNNNVLGVTSSSLKSPSNTHGLVSYPSQTAGATATANLLKSSSQYSGIIASASGTPQQQALAIAQSPWHLGGQGLKAAGGTDPYYYKGFVQAGILSGAMPLGDAAATGGNALNRSVAAATTTPSNTTGTASAAGGNVFGIDLMSPVYFIGVILAATVFILVGGIIILKPKLPAVPPIPV